MGKRVYVALALLAVAFVALAGMIVWQALPPPEPVYKGRKLTSWLKLGPPARIISWYGHSALFFTEADKADEVVLPMGLSLVKANPDAQEAIKQAGTNAIPTLLRLLRKKDSPLNVKLMALAQRQRIVKVEYTTARTYNIQAFWGFSTLGTNAQSAVPALIEIANQNISPDSTVFALDSLRCIGPSAKEGVPSLLRWATNSNKDICSAAIYALGRIDPAAAAKAGIK